MGPRPPGPAGTFLGRYPDLAVEIVSLTNSADEVADKLEEYFKAGVRQVWVVYPVHTKVYVYSSTTAVQILAPGDELDGGDVLPGLPTLGSRPLQPGGRTRLSRRSQRLGS